MPRGTRFISGLATVGIVAILAIVCVLTIVVAIGIRREGQVTKDAITASDAYTRSRVLLQEQSTSEVQYLAAPRADLAQSFDTAGTQLDTYLRQLRSQDPTVRRLLSLHARYQAEVHRAFSLAGAGRGPEARRLDAQQVFPLRAQLEGEIAAVNDTQVANARRQLDLLMLFAQTVPAVAIVVFPFVFVLLIAFAVVHRAYRRRLEEAQSAEIARLEAAAFTDSITGLGNHRAFQEGFQEAAQRSLAEGKPLCIALLDIDDFQVMNDRNGHAHGDRVLHSLARVLRRTRSDDRSFRIGGDEFALLVPELRGPAAAAAMERLRREAQRSMLGATLSIGVAELYASAGQATPEAARSLAGVLREQADGALAEAKRLGRNRVVLFDDVKDRVTIVSPEKIEAVRLLLDEGRMHAAFQPIWSLRTEEVLGYEGLARPPEELGLDGPGEAFELAERIGRAHELDSVCRRAILEGARRLPANSLLFLNVAPQTLDHNLLSGTSLADDVRKAGLTPEQIVLEVTERRMQRLAHVVREAKRLRALGFRIALDDVGSGNAGLEVLRQLDVQYVKVDRSILVAAMTDPAAGAVLAGIVAFARHTGAVVIVEGIETQDMLHRLVVEFDEEDSPYAGQGYLLGAPAGQFQSGPLVGHATRLVRDRDSDVSA